MISADKRKLIADFARDNQGIPELQFINEDPEGFQCNQIVDGGYVNYIYRVESADKQHSVVLKYGETKMRAVEVEISLDRQIREYEAMKLLQCILPEHGIKPYCYDSNHHIIAMEDLSDMTLLTKRFLSGDFDLCTAKILGKTLAQLHQRTSKERTSEEQWKEWERIFGDKDYVTSFLGYFKVAFIEDHPLNVITEGVRPTYRHCVAQEAQYGLLEKAEAIFYTKQCLVHADCHGAAVFVKDNQLKIFDYEFFLLGHGAMNLAYLAMSCVIWEHRITGMLGIGTQEIRQKTEDFKRNLVQGYLEEHQDLEEGNARKKFMQDLALCSGFMAFFFTNLRPKDDGTKLTDQDKIHLMKMAISLMKHHEDINSLEDFLQTMKQHLYSD